MHFTTIETVNFEATKNVCQNPTLLPPYTTPRSFAHGYSVSSSNKASEHQMKGVDRGVHPGHLVS